jgi:hypothetical protein
MLFGTVGEVAAERGDSASVWGSATRRNRREIAVFDGVGDVWRRRRLSVVAQIRRHKRFMNLISSHVSSINQIVVACALPLTLRGCATLGGAQVGV